MPLAWSKIIAILRPRQFSPWPPQLTRRILQPRPVEPLLEVTAREGRLGDENLLERAPTFGAAIPDRRIGVEVLARDLPERGALAKNGVAPPPWHIPRRRPSA